MYLRYKDGKKKVNPNFSKYSSWNLFNIGPLYFVFRPFSTLIQKNCVARRDVCNRWRHASSITSHSPSSAVTFQTIKSGISGQSKYLDRKLRNPDNSSTENQDDVWRWLANPRDVVPRNLSSRFWRMWPSRPGSSPNLQRLKSAKRPSSKKMKTIRNYGWWT